MSNSYPQNKTPIPGSSPKENGAKNPSPFWGAGWGVLALLFFFFFLIPHSASALTCGIMSTGGNWNSAGTWFDCGGGVPGAGDDVIATSTSGDSTITANITVNSVDFNGYDNILTHNSGVTLTVDSFDGSNRSLRFDSLMTYTKGSDTLSVVSFTSTAATGTVTTAGKSLGGVTFNGVGGGWQFLDSFTITGSATFSNGSLDFNDQTIIIPVFLSSTGLNRKLYLKSSNITCSGIGSGAHWTFNVTAGSNVFAGTSVITLNAPAGTAANFQGGGYTYNNVILAANTSQSILDANNTFANLTRTGGASVTANDLTLVGNQTVTGTFTVNGASSTARVLVKSSTLGTARTITAATVSASNVDFQDITGAGAASWDLSAITGGSGNALGNTMQALGDAAFTAATTTYWVGDSGNWSNVVEWAWGSGLTGGTGRVPLPQDDVVFDNGSFSGASQTVTEDMPRLGRNIDTSGYNEEQTPTLTRTATVTMYGSLTLNSSMTFTSLAMTFEGRTSGMPVGGWTVTSAGKTFVNTTGFQAYGGTYTLQDAFLSTAAGTNFVTGTFNANNFDVTTTLINVTNSSGAIINMGSGAWTLTSTGNVWNVIGTLPTINSNTSTLILSNTTATAKTFTGANKTYNNVVFAGDNITVAGSNTFANFAINNAGLPNGLLLTSNTTQTVTGSFTSNSSLGRVAKLSATPSGNATITRSSGMFCGEYLNIASSTVTTSGSATWYAANSTDVGNNNGWTFSGCPAPNTVSRASTGPANEEVRGGLKIRGGAKFR